MNLLCTCIYAITDSILSPTVPASKNTHDVLLLTHDSDEGDDDDDDDDDKNEEEEEKAVADDETSSFVHYDACELEKSKNKIKQAIESQCMSSCHQSDS